VYVRVCDLHSERKGSHVVCKQASSDSLLFAFKIIIEARECGVFLLLTLLWLNMVVVFEANT